MTTLVCGGERWKWGEGARHNGSGRRDTRPIASNNLDAHKPTQKFNHPYFQPHHRYLLASLVPDHQVPKDVATFLHGQRVPDGPNEIRRLLPHQGFHLGSKNAGEPRFIAAMSVLPTNHRSFEAGGQTLWARQHWHMQFSAKLGWFRWHRGSNSWYIMCCESKTWLMIWSICLELFYQSLALLMIIFLDLAGGRISKKALETMPSHGSSIDF